MACDSTTVYLPEPVPVGRVLYQVTLPPGWKVGINSNDHRQGNILDENDKKVGSFFYSCNPYSHYGSTDFFL